MVKKIFLIPAAVIIVIIIIAVTVFLWPQEPLTDEGCIKYLDARISDSDFGRTKTQFTTDSGLYPMVKADIESKLCTKTVAAVLLDSNNRTILEKAYNLPPFGKGGETGYGDYNANRSLPAGNYNFEFYYGDIFFKKIDITIGQ